MEKLIDNQDSNIRNKNISVMYPFFKLQEYKPIQEIGIDFGTLIFQVLRYVIVEGKLKGRAIKRNEFIDFVANYLEYISYQGSFSPSHIAGLVIEGLMMNRTTDERYFYMYRDLVENKNRNLYLSYLSYNSSAKGYEITESGLEFMLVTKEIPLESRFTVNQLLLKMQIDNGSFGDALNTCRQINLEITRLILEQESIVEKYRFGSKEDQKQYGRYLNSVKLQFENEEVNYKQIMKALGPYMRSKSNLIEVEGEQLSVTASEELRVLKSEVDRGTQLHIKLLESIDKLHDGIVNAEKARIESLFTEYYSFHNEFESWIDRRMPTQFVMSSLLPILLPKDQNQFSITRVFEPQRIRRKHIAIEDKGVALKQKKYVSIDDKFENHVYGRFSMYARILIKSIRDLDQGSNEICIGLEDFINQISESSKSGLIDEREILFFCSQLNLGDENCNIRNQYVDTCEIACVHLLHDNEHPSEFEQIIISEIDEFEWRADPIAIKVVPIKNDYVYLDDDGDRYVQNMNIILICGGV